jgi:hypothetical protein
VTPLKIDFAPSRPLLQRMPQRLRWFAGGVGALLLVVASSFWSLLPAAEAGLMSDPGRAGAHPPLPAAEEIQVVDQAIRRLNFPWAETLNAVESVFADPTEGKLTRIEADQRQARVRISGLATTAEMALALPARLRALPGIDDAVLLDQEPQTGTPAVAFSLELRIRELP